MNKRRRWKAKAKRAQRRFEQRMVAEGLDLASFDASMELVIDIGRKVIERRRVLMERLA